MPPTVKIGPRKAISPPAWYSGVKIGDTSAAESPQQQAVL